MRSKEEKELQTKLAFFDIDGTLSAPQYINEEGQAVIGFTRDGWKEYTDRCREHSYDYCKAVPYVKDFAIRLHDAGVRMYVLSTSQFPGETAAKHVFVEEHYHGIFDEVITTSSDDEKLTIIQQKAQEQNVLLPQCMFVEDTLATLFKAHVLGIRCVHVSNIAAGNITM